MSLEHCVTREEVPDIQNFFGGRFEDSVRVLMEKWRKISFLY